jgi:uncharacterized protein (DUF2336 family)
MSICPDNQVPAETRSVTLAQQAQALTDLANMQSPKDRERLLSALIDLFDNPNALDQVDRPSVQALLEDILLKLVGQAERAIRMRLSERMAEKVWAPPALMVVLAMDEIDIAAPVIANSPVLNDAALIRVLIEATIEHQIEVARRPNLGHAVVDTLLSQAQPAVLTALATNAGTTLSHRHLEDLVEASRRVAALRSPLSRHPQLSAALAERLYAWVGQALKESLLTRFELDPDELDASLAQAILDAHSQADGAALTPSLRGLDNDQDRLDMEDRLVTKLLDADQLKPSFLFRSLSEGKLSLFCRALGRLCGQSYSRMRLAIDCDTPDRLALACYAIGMDRSAFPTVLNTVRKLSGGFPGGGDVRSVNALFGGQGQSEAAIMLDDALTEAQNTQGCLTS